MIPALVGFLLVRALAGGPRRFCRHDILRLFLGAGLGIGLCSACFFVGLLSGIPGLLLEALLLAGAGAGVAWRWKRAACCFCEAPAPARPGWALTALVAALFGVVSLAGVLTFAAATTRSPHGDWDAWAIWNVRARFLYRGTSGVWRDGFTEVLASSHPDYPLLVPAFVARTWKLMGVESQTVPIALQLVFVCGSLGLMASSLWIVRDTRQGLLAGLALAATPALYLQAARQYADVPMAFFVLATLAAMALADRYRNAGFAALAGLAAAMAGWAKNEGLLWFGAFLLARGLAARRRHLPAFVAGAAPVLGVILLFKATTATSSDVFGAAGRAGMLERFLDPARYAMIARATLGQLWNFGALAISPFLMLAVYVAFTGVRTDGRDRTALRSSVLALLLAAGGYFLIYVLRPNNLAWLLATSLDRLLMQLWPGAVFAVFLATRGPGREEIKK
jgi:hypothetical protein